MNRENPKFRQEFDNNFLNPNHISNGYDNHNRKPDGSGQHYDASYESSHLQNYSKSYNPSDSREPYNHSSEQKPNERNARRYKQFASGGNFNTPSEHHNHHRQRQQLGYDYSIHHTSSYLAGGDGHTQRVRNQQIAHTRSVQSNYIQQGQTHSSAATYNKGSNSSSRFSNSSKETAVERPVGRKGKQLLNLTMSKANLMQAVDEGINDLEQKRSSNQKPADLGTKTSNDTYNCDSISSNACSSPSAGLINSKIIHPMLKRFRLLYLNSIKEDCDILQELETLPNKMNELCKKLENRE